MFIEGGGLASNGFDGVCILVAACCYLFCICYILASAAAMMGAARRARTRPDYGCSVADLQRCLELWFLQRDSRDVWKLIKNMRLAVPQG